MSELNPTPREGAVDGLGILGATMLGHYAITSEEMDVAGREVLPDVGLSSALLVAAAVILIAYVGLALRVHGVKEGLRQVLTHAWPTLLAGGILGVITGFPLKAMLSGRSLWVVLGVLYAAALAVILWLYRRGSRPFGRL